MKRPTGEVRSRGMHKFGLDSIRSAAVLLVVSWVAVGEAKSVDVPDLTRGDEIPEDARHDWTLGATGMRGWMFSHDLGTSKARQIAVTEVADGSPADGLMTEGDVILGAGGERFSYDPRTEFGKALTRAETGRGGGRLSLIRWREGTTSEVVLELPVLGEYSDTAPFDCDKSSNILERGYANLATRMERPDYHRGMNAIPRALNALALLTSGDERYLDHVRKEARWAAEFETGSFQTWYYAYLIMLLAEYQIMTGDDQFAEGLERLTLAAAEGQSIVGSWGHKFAGPDGRLLGYGMMNAPGVPLTIALIIAREAGVEDPAVHLAIERSARLIRFYIGKGAVPYGDHAPWTQTHEDNGKCGMAAVMFNLLEERRGADFFTRMAVASHGAERDTGHTGNFTNLLWALPAVTLAGPTASGAWMEEFGAWYFDLARRWDGSFRHQGPPKLKGDKFRGWDSTGAYLLGYAMAKRNLVLSGKEGVLARQLDSAAAEGLIENGRGWSRGNRTEYYDGLDTAELVRRLSSWSPTVRSRAAAGLHRRRGKLDLVPVLVDKLDSDSVTELYGACDALGRFKGEAAVPGLAALLKHDDMWVRVQAAEALAAIGDAAMPHLPTLLKMIARGPTDDDPRGMEQRFLCFSVFQKMMRGSMDAVDRDLLKEAVAAGLQNQDGRARGAVGRVYQQLSYEEIRPLLPMVVEAVKTPAPSGIMFASGVRTAGLEILARHRIADGMDLCFKVMEIDKWGKKNRINRCLDALAEYGGSAKPVLPRLRQLEQDLLKHRESRSLGAQIEQVRGLIVEIENADDTGDLRSLD